MPPTQRLNYSNQNDTTILNTKIEMPIKTMLSKKNFKFSLIQAVYMSKCPRSVFNFLI